VAGCAEDGIHMSEFRAALEQFLTGASTAEDTRRRVAGAAAREPQVAPAMLAVIETYRTAGRLSEEFAQQLQRTVRENSGPPPVAPIANDATAVSAAAPPAVPAPASLAPAASAPAASVPPVTSGAGNAPRRLEAGSVLKERFVLEALVAGGDKGGMGVVFKALDRIKREAHDRNPYVAIKLLNEDFKQHPDSMLALQREARRAQTLAHPNIITVYDFDRDGDVFFMAMELLQGSPLDEVIKAHRERGGLPTQEALQIIVQLARGLSYAHTNNIVHSDFKPSNAFLLKDGGVKLLDFGIARATKLPEGEKTRFDAGSLGAMTLPYASCEQFERQDPDPSDDVYALGVVSYELLTGRHPFERPDPNNPGRLIRTDAIAARNAKMTPVPAPIPGLSGQQWRTLRRALAFEGMTPRRRPVKTLAVAAVALVLLLITSSMLLGNYLHRSRLQGLIQQLQSHDPAAIAAALGALQKYSPDERGAALLNDNVQANLLTYYIERARGQFDVAAGHYDYGGAMATLKEAQSLSRAYEDSRQLTDAVDRIESERKAAILRQADAFEAELSQGLLIPSQGGENVRSTLATIRQLDPAHPLLTDKRLPIVFSQQVRTNIDGNHLATASALLTAGLQYAPNDPGLLDLKDRILRQQSVEQLSAQTGELEPAVRPLGSNSATLADFRAARTQLDALHRAQPDSAVLRAAQDQLGRVIDPLVSAAVAKRDVTDVQATLDEFVDLLPAAMLAKDRAEIGSVTGNTAAREDASAPLRARIEQETANLQTDQVSVSRLQTDLQSLETLAGPGDSALTTARTRASQGYLSQSQSMLTSRRLTEAQHDLDLARQFGLAADAYQTQANAIAQSRAQLDADNRARESAAQLTAAKQRVLDQALADHIDAAQTQFAHLKQTLPADDPFVTTDAPRAIAEAYLVRARRAALQTRFDEAFNMAQAAQSAAPNVAGVAANLQRFQTARDLANSLNTAQDFGSLRPQVERLREEERASGNRTVMVGLSRVVAARIHQVQGQNPAEAARLRASAEPLFPNLLGDATVAEGSQSAGPIPAETTQPSETVSSQAVQPTSTANPSVSPRSAAGNARGVTPGPRPDSEQSANAPAASTADSGPVIARGGPCSGIAIGAPAGTMCHDEINKNGGGPQMMIIPAGDGLPMFAMMRNETSVANYNLYCLSVKGCTPASAASSDLPVTTASADDAAKYAAWLSEASGAKYRLPSEREWRRAAGSAHDPDANCVADGQGSRGTVLRATSLGAMNEYGLRDVVGNVQEWALPAGGGLKALGGAIGDPLPLCQTAFSRTHNGQPDGRTGFRLLREMR
jgi:serine/threonine protein kinase